MIGGAVGLALPLAGGLLVGTGRGIRALPGLIRHGGLVRHHGRVAAAMIRRNVGLTARGALRGAFGPHSSAHGGAAQAQMIPGQVAQAKAAATVAGWAGRVSGRVITSLSEVGWAGVGALEGTGAALMGSSRHFGEEAVPYTVGYYGGYGFGTLTSEILGRTGPSILEKRLTRETPLLIPELAY